jgi:hypothetical protein
MKRLPGFVVVGPLGIVSGTFGTSRAYVLEQAESVVVTNGYHATEVRVSTAAIVVGRAAQSWPLSAARIAAFNQRIWGRRRGVRPLASQSSQKSRRAAARTTGTTAEGGKR